VYDVHNSDLDIPADTRPYRIYAVRVRLAGLAAYDPICPNSPNLQPIPIFRPLGWRGQIAALQTPILECLSIEPRISIGLGNKQTVWVSDQRVYQNGQIIRNPRNASLGSDH
jgi:hypothetical protein